MADQGLQPGTVYVCATPLGNLDDLSERAKAVLAAADVVAAERPQHTRKLLSHLGIPAGKLRPAAESTSEQSLDDIVRVAAEGGIVAVVADAGTPGVSDPGAPLVRRALAAGCPVRPIPGPSSLTAALSVSGFETRRVLMVGFPPRKPGARREALTEWTALPAAIVLFESPKRVRATVTDLGAVAPRRPLMLLREATKIHEEILRGTPGEVLAALDDAPKGEMTLVVSPPGEADGPSEANEDWSSPVADLLADGVSPRDVVRALVALADLPKGRAFDIVQAVRDGMGSREGDL
jgi:16S rRNA (cytidine1402-2'-O)-methyltransferase